MEDLHDGLPRGLVHIQATWAFLVGIHLRLEHPLLVVGFLLQTLLELDSLGDLGPQDIHLALRVQLRGHILILRGRLRRGTVARVDSHFVLLHLRSHLRRCQAACVVLFEEQTLTCIAFVLQVHRCKALLQQVTQLSAFDIVVCTLLLIIQNGSRVLDYRQWIFRNRVTLVN